MAAASLATMWRRASGDTLRRNHLVNARGAIARLLLRISFIDARLPLAFSTAFASITPWLSAYNRAQQRSNAYQLH